MSFKKLLFLFIVVPLLELALFMALADTISLPVTLAIIIITGALGAYLAKKQGSLALRNFKQALGSGQLPHVEATDGILILVAGAVLLTPGFLTDAVGFALLVPQARALVRGRLVTYMKQHIHTSVSGMPSSAVEQATPREMKPARGRVVSEEV